MTAANLFIIEAPGKRRQLSQLLRQVGVRDIEVLATVGHIGANPLSLKPLAVDEAYRETAYRLKPGKERLAAVIGAAARAAKRIFLATDDDQEGDVIARDALRFGIDEADRGKVKRMRLRALTLDEVRAALAAATPFDPLAAAPGDARRIIDRVIGSLSSEAGAGGRVQSSLLLLLQDQPPVAGVMTYVLKARDGRGDWIAQAPVLAGQTAPPNGLIDGAAEVGGSILGVLGGRPMNHDEIVLSASIATGQPIAAVAAAMQTLYERGRLSYPRATDHALTPASVRRLHAIARIHGADFDPAGFRAIRELTGEHAHEAPNPLVLDLPLNRRFELLSFEDQVLAHIARNLIDGGVPCRCETPRREDIAALPPEAARLPWRRRIPLGQRLWSSQPPPAGWRAWTREQSLLHFMTRHKLGRPSTVVEHVETFLRRGLVDAAFRLTPTGRAWRDHARDQLGDKPLSHRIEDYIERRQQPPAAMVAEMVALFGLRAVAHAVLQQPEVIDEELEISAGRLP